MEVVQLDLFKDRERERIEETHLVCDSAKNAFYHIWIEQLDEGFIVRKESGISSKVLDRKNWWFEKYQEALEYQRKLVREKTNPGIMNT